MGLGFLSTLLQVLFVDAYSRLLILCSMTNKPACFLSLFQSVPAEVLEPGFHATRCSVTVVLECEYGSPALDLLQLLDVLLDIWVPSTGCILQDGSDRGGVGSCSDLFVGIINTDF